MARHKLESLDQNPSVFLDWRALEDNNQSDYQGRFFLLGIVNDDKSAKK